MKIILNVPGIYHNISRKYLSGENPDISGTANKAHLKAEHLRRRGTVTTHMLKRAVVVGVILAAIFVGVDAGRSFLPACMEKQLGEPAQQTYCRSSLVVAGFRSFYTAVKSEHEFVVAGSTIVIALFTIVLAWSTIKLWKASDEQIKIAARSAKSAEAANDLSREIFRFGDRPWVWLDGVKAAGPLRVSGDGAKLQVKFTMKNIGKSPAIGPLVHAKLVPMPKGGGIEKAKIEAIQREIIIQALRSPISFETTLIADHPISSPTHLLSLSSGEINQDETILEAAIVGLIDYKFISDQSRHGTPFCLTGVLIPTAKGTHAAKLGGLVAAPTGVQPY